ncbi:MAG: hypothetical protein WCF06_12380, partial [Nitrososphaeraceae archaeon]
IHPKNASLAAACDGLETGAISAFLQDIIEDNSKHRLVQAQQESFGRGFYDGYAVAWAIAMQLCQNSFVLHLKKILSLVR